MGGWLTPPTIPAETICRVLEIPADRDIVMAVNGCLYSLTLRSNWVQFGAVTPDEIAVSMLNMWSNYLKSECGVTCEQIIECIENDPDVQEAFNNWLVNALNTNPAVQAALYNAVARGGIMPAGVSGSQINPDIPDCDMDTLYGQLVSLIDNMNQNNIDAQQVIELESNAVERIQTVAAAIPGVGELPVDELIGYVQGLWSDDLFEAYEANDTTEYRWQLKCDLRCRARDNGCKVSLDLLINYFLERLVYSGEDTIEDIVNFLIIGVWEGTQVNDTFYLAQLLWLKYGNAFFPIVGLKSLQVYLTLGTPSHEWATVCDDCDTEWEYFVTLAELADWTDYALADEGVYSPGDGWGGSASPTFATSNLFGRSFGAPTHILTVEPIWTALMTGDWNNIFVGDMPALAVSVSEIQSGLSQEIPFDETVDGLVVGGYENHDFTIPMVGKYINGLIVRGIGYQPPQLGG